MPGPTNPHDNPTVHATLFQALKAPAGRAVDWHWPTFCALLATPPPAWQAGTRDALPLIKLGRFRDDTRADGSPLESVSGVECDYDGGSLSVADAAERLHAAGVLCVLVTTGSHTPQHPRWRVFAPLSVAAQPSARPRLVARLNGVLGGVLAPESFVPKQVFFIGRLKHSPHYECIPVAGACVDTLTGLDAGAKGMPEHVAGPAAPADEARAFALAGNASAWPDNRHMLLSALKSCSAACTYKVWQEISAAFFFASGGGADPMAEWLTWCQSAPEKYPGDDAAMQKWRDFGAMTSYTLGTLYHHAHASGWRMDHAHKASAPQPPGGGDDDTHRTPLVTLDDCLANWVWLSEQNVVVLRERGDLILRWPNVQLDYSASKMQAPDNSIRRRTVQVLVADVWQARADRTAAVGATFAPGMPPFCLDPRGVRSFNMWRPTVRTRPVEPKLVALFLRHVEYLLPDPAQREQFLLWLAHCEQQPQVLPQHHWLMITRTQGIGRNWLSALLGKVWLRQVALSVDLQHMFQSGFNEDIARKTFACVDELDVGGTAATRNAFGTNLKALLTAQARQINVKYGLKSLEFNCTRWLLLSNSETAVPLQASDRRLNVVRNPGVPREADYYSILYNALESEEFINAVGWWLAHADLSAYNPGARASMSDMKRTVVGVGRDEVEEAIDAFCVEWPSCIAPADAMRDYVAGTTGVGRDRLRYINRMLQHTQAEGLVDRLCLHGSDKAPSACVLLREHDRWRNTPAVDKVAECLRGMGAWQVRHFDNPQNGG